MFKYEAKVIGVVDGDTIDVIIDLGFSVFIKERLRLYGVNTPETRTRNKKEKAAGLKAKRYVSEMLLDKSVKIRTLKNKRGKFGRYLAIVLVGNDVAGYPININKELLDRGLAKKYMCNQPGFGA